MPLSDNERLAISADMTYDTVEEKLLYVNGKLGYLLEDGTINPHLRKRAWDHNKFYRTIGKIETKTMERLYEIAKYFKEETLNDLELLYELKRGKLQMFRQAKAKGSQIVANTISDSIITMMPYLTSLREAIKIIMEEDIKKFERQIETSDLVPPLIQRTA